MTRVTAHSHADAARAEPVATRGYALPVVREIHPVPDAVLRQAMDARGASPEVLERARADERTRLYRELHDGVAAGLVGAILTAGAAHTAAAADHRTLLAGIEQDLIEVARELRVLIDGLRPPLLDELGVVGAIRRHAGRLEAGSGLRIDVIAGPGLVALPGAVEHAAHRIAAEAVTNAARHAGATRCEVTLERAGDTLLLTVADDGSGLPAAPREGVGLTSMRERAAELAGRCEWRERPGGGTLVHARLPLAAR